MTSILTDVKDELERAVQGIKNAFEHAGPVIEAVAQKAESAQSDPLIQAAEAALGLTPGMRAAIGSAIAALDAEVTKELEALRAQIPAPAAAEGPVGPDAEPDPAEQAPA